MLLTLYAVISTLSHRKTVESRIAVVRKVEAKYQVIKKVSTGGGKKKQPKSNKRSKQWSWKEKQSTRSRGEFLILRCLGDSVEWGQGGSSSSRHWMPTSPAAQFCSGMVACYITHWVFLPGQDTKSLKNQENSFTEQLQNAKHLVR